MARVTDQASSSITIDAEPARIMSVIADFERYPEWAGFIKKVEVVDAGSGERPRTVHFVLDAGVIKADYTLAYTWDDDTKVSWTLESGSLKQNDGSYTLTPSAGSTDVRYELAVDVGMPMLGMFKRKAEKVIIDTALKELKKRVESGA